MEIIVVGNARITSDRYWSFSLILSSSQPKAGVVLTTEGSASFRLTIKPFISRDITVGCNSVFSGDLITESLIAKRPTAEISVEFKQCIAMWRLPFLKRRLIVLVKMPAQHYDIIVGTKVNEVWMERNPMPAFKRSPPPWQALVKRWPVNIDFVNPFEYSGFRRLLLQAITAAEGGSKSITQKNEANNQAYQRNKTQNL